MKLRAGPVARLLRPQALLDVSNVVLDDLGAEIWAADRAPAPPMEQTMPEACVHLRCGSALSVQCHPGCRELPSLSTLRLGRS